MQVSQKHDVSKNSLNAVIAAYVPINDGFCSKVNLCHLFRSLIICLCFTDVA